MRLAVGGTLACGHLFPLIDRLRRRKLIARPLAARVIGIAIGDARIEFGTIVLAGRGLFGRCAFSLTVTVEIVAAITVTGTVCIVGTGVHAVSAEGTESIIECAMGTVGTAIFRLTLFFQTVSVGPASSG